MNVPVTGTTGGGSGSHVAALHKAAWRSPLIAMYPGVMDGLGASTRGDLLERILRCVAAGRLRDRPGWGDRGSGRVLGGDTATRDRWFDLQWVLSGVSPPRRLVPYRAGQAMGRLPRGGARITGVPPALSDGEVGVHRHERACSSTQAEREPGFRITPLIQGLQRIQETLGGSPAAAPRAAGS